ncbi:BREX-1 system phosphatase PglZ type A [Cloacibacillus porcorum]|uniref:BREX-1 system phosphatase PglZ type A n=1 Tax=Cloacibacillus porcorum TaxID=1197717 RepID=UPI003CFDF946
MDLKQIAEKLNKEFAADERRLVFWYDAGAEFAADVDGGDLVLENAAIYRLEKDNQFYTKYFLECVDTETSYLIYAPFPKPDIRENHLADMVKYSREFFADKASLICVDLGIAPEFKPIIQNHIKFFASKERCQKFYDLKIDSYRKDIILIGMMSVVCKAKTASFEEVLRAVLIDDAGGENRYLPEFEKFGLLDSFWELCEALYGYHDISPSLKNLAASFFITYTGHYVNDNLPPKWRNRATPKTGSVVAFMDNMMNNARCRAAYDEISRNVAADINAAIFLREMAFDSLAECDSFEIIDEMIVAWVVDNLLSENTGAKLAGMDINAICRRRKTLHFGNMFRDVYSMLIRACQIIEITGYRCPEELSAIIRQYTKNDYKYDTYYREFYTYYDRIESRTDFEALRERVENIYTNVYLDKITLSWSNALSAEESIEAATGQECFYRRHVLPAKERVVVIISDALRYEVAAELMEILSEDEKCRSAHLDIMYGVLPSVTKLGMAALLPHEKIEVDNSFKVSVDGRPCDTLSQREAILRSEVTNSRCLQYDEVMAAKREEIRSMFGNKEVVYVYHNQIDARGDKASTENEVFYACAESVKEIHRMVRRLTEDVSARHFVITADHGFIYKRDKIREYDKINGPELKGIYVGKRYIISREPIEADGVRNYRMSTFLRGSDSLNVAVPSGTSIFKIAGSGQNYVHGGASPQEMLIPVLDVKTSSGHQETRIAAVDFISTTKKITSLVQSLEFYQTEPVTDIVKEAVYKLFFVSDENEKISNEVTFEAKSRDSEAAKRISRLKFTFKNKRYHGDKKYYLVAYLDSSNSFAEPVFKYEMVMDIAFADDFGF